MKSRKEPPYPFVFDLLGTLEVEIRSFFGGFGLYYGERILLILFRKPDTLPDNGVWVATEKEFHHSLRTEIPSLRTIELFGSPVSTWQVIPESGERFEQDVRTACEMICRFDPRIGRIPKRKKKKKPD